MKYFTYNFTLFIESNVTQQPKIRLVPELRVDEGTAVVKIPCYAEGIPTPAVTWEAISVGLLRLRNKNVKDGFRIQDNILESMVFSLKTIS